MTTFRFSRFAFLLVATILLTVSVASAAGPYQFYSVTPCRIADTRGNGFTGLSGPPSLSASANGAIVPLGSDASFQITLAYGTATAGGSTDLILDVTGYFK